ncbi:Piso0_000637 [Millerozyma farinosa CBS 7064]|uniref:Piso0_000637 protein n=1 Tax=Pichia sorbitophila (strain ATCC MYA-4447 / BCRC 22081 / CBS 7064 / NBRC 10061 / NRRL Y-12695) TaxID=559304 RepID=G8YPM7_PICSO|nr:Piso0_000637 [Millerozyma farinosa CBS 7064]
MAITVLAPNADAASHSQGDFSRSKVIFVTLLFLLSLASFVAQTEFTSEAYKIGFEEPVVLLLVTHGSWWILWPVQVFSVSFWRTLSETRKQITKKRKRTGEAHTRLLERGEAHLEPASVVPERLPTTRRFNPWRTYKKNIVKQVHTVYHTSILIYEANVHNDTSVYNCNDLIGKNPRISNSTSVFTCFKSFASTPSFKYIFSRATLIAFLLTLAGATWYAAMSLTDPSDVTAIYNCSAFTAYAFAIPILKERFSILKASSVIIAVAGVFIVAYSGSDNGAKAASAKVEYPYRLWGNLLILTGAVLYGYYEVLYKKYLCIPAHLVKVITPRRQSTFANFVMGIFGFITCLILGITIFVGHVSGIHKFNFFDYGSDTTRIWLYISGSIVSNLLFSASFLSLMALTSPVLSSVSSLLTIFLIGIVEWFFFGNSLTSLQLLGDFLVIIGFVILTAASWKEISEGDDHDEIENASTYSFPASVYSRAESI